MPRWKNVSGRLRPLLCINIQFVTVLSGLLVLPAILWTKLQDVEHFLSSLKETPCLLNNNYMLMEISRPISECGMCEGVNGPIVLYDTSAFDELAYSSVPILVKGGASNWPAVKHFDFDFFSRLYNPIGEEEAILNAEDECQFLPFKTEFTSVRQAFAVLGKGQLNTSHWYFGWSNCNPKIRETLRRYYHQPSFLPADCERSALDWIFIGTPGPATTMHLDYVLRPSWQAQISGVKIWRLMPPPECLNAKCQGFNITVEKGDIVFIDTNQWYHDTYVQPESGLSISVGSEYD